MLKKKWKMTEGRKFVLKAGKELRGEEEIKHVFSLWIVFCYCCCCLISEKKKRLRKRKEEKKEGRMFILPYRRGISFFFLFFFVLYSLSLQFFCRVEKETKIITVTNKKIFGKLTLKTQIPSCCPHHFFFL